MPRKHPISGILSASKQLRCKLWNLLPVVLFHDIFDILILITIMAMRNTHQNPALLCALQCHRTKAVLMNMNYLIFWMRMKKLFSFSRYPLLHGIRRDT